jgi:hypothetical protein
MHSLEALYGYNPPLVLELMILGHESPVQDFLQQKQQMIAKLKANLTQAHDK